MRERTQDRSLRRMRHEEEEHEDSPCRAKVGYRSEVQAQQALDRILSHEKEWASAKFPCRHYFCDGGPAPCFRFHLTSAPLREGTYAR